MFEKIKHYTRNWFTTKSLSNWFTTRSLGEVWPIILLLLISGIVCLLNFTPNTFLSGWDTLHPEFNFSLNLERAFFGVFRVEQGLGAVAAHSHMADIPRMVILYLEHFVLPLNLLRYLYIFLNIILGPIGMYLLLNKYFLKQKTASFLGALFYLLNLGTMQIFNVPFEMFTTLFATLPFIIYFTNGFLRENNKRIQYLLGFCISILFTSPSAYAATLWLVFFGCLVLYILSICIINFREKKHQLKDGFLLIFLTILLNLFWLSPNIYFVLNHGLDVQNANINLLFSDQAFLKNKEFGNLSSLLLLKSFYFDWNVYTGNNSFGYLLNPFIEYLKNLPILTLGYGFGLSLVIGAIYTAKKLKKNSIPIFILLMISLFFLINNNFPTGFLFTFLQDKIPFFKEALRFPDDKIFNIYVFLISIFFGYFCLFIIEKLNKQKVALFTIAVIVIIIGYNFPSFQGNFINKAMRVEIPKNYFRLFDYFNKQPSDTKVANLPINSPYGWVYYDWYPSTSSGQVYKPSFQGAGFLYFGIKQPLLDRDFDRWSPYNESYYREMSYAIYKKDVRLLTNVINKYNIGFIFIDKSVSDPQNPKTTLFFDESKKLIKLTGLLKETKSFGKIEVFKLNIKIAEASTVNTNINILPLTKTTYDDSAFNLYGDYITGRFNINFNNINYPFRDLIDNQSRLHNNILSLDSEKITLTPGFKVNNFKTQSLSQNLRFIPSDIILERKDRRLNISFYPNTPIFDNTPSSLPIKGSFDLLSASNNLYLSINENEVFKLNQLLNNTPLVIGKAVLKNGDNRIVLFDSSTIIPVDYTSQIINPFFSNCDNGTNPSATISDSGINIKGKGNICVLVPLGFFQSEDNQDQTILTNFGFEYKGNSKISACIFSQENSTCLYYITPQKMNNLYTLTFPLKQNDVSKRAIKIFFDQKPNFVQNIKLTNLFSSYSNSISQINIDKQILNNSFINSSDISFSKIYLSNNIIYDPDFDITKIKKTDNDCGENSSGLTKEIVNIKGIDTIKYSANIGSFCDHFSFPNFLHKQGLLLAIESKNESGLPLTLCITNYTTRRCDIYTNLSFNKDFKKEVFLLAPTDENGTGYDVNLENLGIKGSPSVNYLKSIEFIPIPYGFLSNISEGIVNIPSLFAGKIEKVIKYNPLMFSVKTNSKPTILNLNYSFEKGFKAYTINCKSELACFIKTSLAPLFSKEIKHVLVNNWSNGWIIDKSNIKDQNSKIAIVFVPQYLEFLGFVIVVMVFTSLLIKVKTNK